MWKATSGGSVSIHTPNFYAVLQKCEIPIQKDLSNYMIKTTAGGEFIATVNMESNPSDPDYKPERQWPGYQVCGSMWRGSGKYRSVSSWSADSRYGNINYGL